MVALKYLKKGNWLLVERHRSCGDRGLTSARISPYTGLLINDKGKNAAFLTTSANGSGPSFFPRI